MSLSNKKESYIVEKFEQCCLEEGWFCQRIDTKGVLTKNGFGRNSEKGASDRIVFVPITQEFALAVTVELKRPKGGEYSPMQLLYKKRVLNHGVRWYGIHTIEAIQNFRQDIKSVQSNLQRILNADRQTRA